MTTGTRLTCVGAVVLLASLIANVAGAQYAIDKRTYFTFNGPVAVPGVTLPAGTYLFHATDTNYRHVIQVKSEDGTTAYAQFFATEVYRSKVTGDPEVRFLETGENMPAAIRSFWLPLDSIGFELQYPADQARRLASGIPTPVAPAIVAAPTVVLPKPVVAPAPEPAPVLEEEVTFDAAPIAVAEAPEAVAPAPVDLPKTDSPTATMLILGLGALLAGVFVYTARTTIG